ncbi:MAG: putative manganese transporter [Kiritimatiellia bacterium]
MITGILKHSLMITGFVGVMMLVIEYVNVVTEGAWQERLSRRRWGQYAAAGLLGATPGCLGAFAVVAMYAHRRISLGALTAAMIATSGDESFFMFAVIPRTALLVTGILLVLGVGAGALTDRVLGARITGKLSCAQDFRVHEGQTCGCFEPHRIIRQWKNCSAVRGVLTLSLAAFLCGIACGKIGPGEWNWVRVTLVAATSTALFVAITVPDHFLEEHLWGHVVRGHLPRIFLWTMGALLIVELLTGLWDLSELVRKGKWLVLAIAGLVGIVPQSGPHFVFVTMFDQGLAPLSVLVASSIVQDGHGMLPLLAHSRRAFVVVKAINLAIGLAAGAVLMLWGS